MEKIELKENDLYDFRYKPEVAKDMFEPYHCFDGKLIARECNDGSFILVDTYWTSDSRSFTLEQALERGTLEFVCNLSEVEVIPEYAVQYYNRKDVFNLSRQHGSYKQYAIKKGTERSKEAILQAISDKVDDQIRQMEYSGRTIERLNKLREEVAAGNLNVII